MINKIKPGITSVWDFYRTAPFGETYFLLTSYLSFNKFKDGSYTEGIFFSTTVVLSALVTYFQFDLKKRLEKVIEDHGFVSSAFEKTVRNWCDRQTARVVVKKYGHLDDYVKLCEKNKEKMRYSYIPHF